VVESHFSALAATVAGLGAQKIAVGSSKRELRLAIRYNDNGIAIKAFKYSLVRVQAGRIDADKHWGAAVWARMNFNSVGREAK
jgi:hypothetical protein